MRVFFSFEFSWLFPDVFGEKKLMPNFTWCHFKEFFFFPFSSKLGCFLFLFFCRVWNSTQYKHFFLLLRSDEPSVFHEQPFCLTGLYVCAYVCVLLQQIADELSEFPHFSWVIFSRFFFSLTSLAAGSHPSELPYYYLWTGFLGGVALHCKCHETRIVFHLH